MIGRLVISAAEPLNETTNRMVTPPANPYVRSLGGVSLLSLTQDDAAYCHLSKVGWSTLKDCTVYTTLEGIEMEMRQSRGFTNTATYAPLLAGFSILDQLGRAYLDRSKARHPKGGSSIEHALYYF